MDGDELMFQLASGVKIPLVNKIHEAFQIAENSIQFHLSFEKIKPLVDEFLDQLPEPLFFVLEIPLSRQEELELRKDDSKSVHKNVCYLDGQSKEQMKAILQKYGDLLLNDGISQFAIASHSTNDEIFIQKYKVISIYCNEPVKYIGFLNKYGLVQTDKLLTAWDTFSHEAPGEVRKIVINGMSVYDVYDDLVKIGMYTAKIMED